MKKVVLIVIVIIIGIQFIPVDRSNPPVTDELNASPEVIAVLERACYDCHSNETVWPWYAKVAPVSWQISSHVVVGRRHVNFSEWGAYELGKQQHIAEEIWQEVEDNGMPLKGYVRLHKDAVLTQADKDLIHAWSKEVEADAEEFQENAEVNENDEG